MEAFALVCNCKCHGAMRLGYGKVLIGFIHVRIFGRRNGKSQAQACLCMGMDIPVFKPSVSVEVQRVKAYVFMHTVYGIFKFETCCFLFYFQRAQAENILTATHQKRYRNWCALVKYCETYTAP